MAYYAQDKGGGWDRQDLTAAKPITATRYSMASLT